MSDYGAKVGALIHSRIFCKMTAHLPAVFFTDIGMVEGS